MRAGFVHEATVELAAGADQRAPGAAVTVALCGSWEHEGKCAIPHCTAVDDRAAQSLRSASSLATFSPLRDQDALVVHGRRL